MIRAPLSSDGASQVSVMLLGPSARARRLPGASGAPALVRPVATFEYGPVPSALIAATR